MEDPDSSKYSMVMEGLSVAAIGVPAFNKTFSVAGFQIRLKRFIQPFVLNIYLPTAAMVLISFISFSIPIDQVPGRMALCVTLFLMLVNLSSSARNSGPKVA